MHWDPEVESPASIAVIGCGPIGIEAALYARFLGYDVDLFDAKRPAHEVVRWNRRSMGLSVSECTTSLGISALKAQSAEYDLPAMETCWSGAQFAEEYLLPIAKSDLLVDGIHINSRVTEVGRVRYYREEIANWQDRANDEFRLVIESRDRGIYTARADLILDCRGMYSSSEGYGPGGAHAVNALVVRDALHQWLPGDPRFETRMLDQKHVIVFGNSERAVRFVEEWYDLLVFKGDSIDKKPFSGTLTWIISCDRSDSKSIQVIDAVRWELAVTKATSVIASRGVEKVEFFESTTTWKLQLLSEDDSTIELLADAFAPFTNRLPTQSLGPTLYCNSWANEVISLTASDSVNLNEFYQGWAGWNQATLEPNYFRLGARNSQHGASGLVEGFQQIKDVFALLGARENLDLYSMLRKQHT